MLTTREFRAARDRHVRRAMRWLCAATGLIIAVLITFLWFADPTESFRAHIHPDFPSWLVGPTLVIAPLTLLPVIVWVLHLLGRRDPRLVCPYCDRGLFRASCRVLGTGQCPRCERGIIADPEPPKPASLTRGEAQALANRYWRVVRDFFLGFPAILLLGVGLGLGCEALVDAGWMSRAVSAGIATVMLVLTFAWMVWMLVRAFGMPRMLVRCPRCGWQHEPRHVVRHGQCAICTQLLIADPPAPAAS